jgi:hypothetical protein
MENFEPLDHIPDNWREKSRCPLCSEAPLLIDHRESDPDHFFCPNCELCFQVAKGSPSILVLQDPIEFDTGYVGKWVEMKTLIQFARTQIYEVKSVASVSMASTPKVEPPAEKEVIVEEKVDPIYDQYSGGLIETAITLYEMGNSRQSIRDILARNGQLSEDDIDEIINYVYKRKRPKESGKAKLPRWALGCIFFPVICLLSYLCMMLYFQLSFSKQLATSPDVMDVSIINFEKLPGFILNMIPDEVENMEMQKATVTKYASTNLPQTACPANAQGAATLFGGQAAEWEKTDAQNAWIMQSNYFRTINVPDGFIAVMFYLNHGLNMQITSGPARIQNTYLISIGCP